MRAQDPSFVSPKLNQSQAAATASSSRLANGGASFKTTVSNAENDQRKRARDGEEDASGSGGKKRRGDDDEMDMDEEEEEDDGKKVAAAISESRLRPPQLLSSAFTEISLLSQYPIPGYILLQYCTARTCLPKSQKTFLEYCSNSELFTLHTRGKWTF